MSGADLAFGVLGVAPLLVESIKAFRKLHKAAKTAKRCVKELKNIDLEVDIQQGRFLNECILLLCLIGEDDIITRAMISDPLHAKWTEQSLELQIQKRLGDSYELCRRITARIRDIQLEIAKNLECFDLVRSQAQKGEPWKTKFRQLSQRMHFVFDKRDLEETIAMLGRKLSDFESLRSQMEQFHGHTASKISNTAAKQMPQYLSEVQKISEEAYIALAASFTCIDSSHQDHIASLCLDVQALNNLQLDMAISYFIKCGSTIRVEPPVRFILQSKAIEVSSTIGYTGSGDQTSSNEIVDASNSTSSTREIQGNSTWRKKLRHIAAKERQPGKRDSRGKFKSSESVLNDPVYSPEEGTSTLDEPKVDLGALKSPCDYLSHECRKAGHLTTDLTYIAFLRKPTLSRYVFYMCRSNQINEAQHTTMISEQSISLYDYLMKESEHVVTNVHQFKLALKLALAVLQYHSTPWLGQDWRISQLQIIPSTERITEDFPLYLSSKLTTPSAISSDIDMEDPQPTLSGFEHRGIHNTTLFCLGVALLEIGHWKTVSRLSKRTRLRLRRD